MKKIQLYCLPHAGGSATIYSQWKTYLAPYIEAMPVELAGRGKRFNEPLHSSFQQVIDDVYMSLNENCNGSPYAIFGHSMGGLIAFEIAHRMIKEHKQEPLILFISGRYPPHIDKKSRLSLLPDGEFINEIMQIDGTPKELFDNKEMLSIFLPILRADYAILDQYVYTPGHPCLNSAIIAIGGNCDNNVLYNELCEWSRYTEQSSDVQLINGGHFAVFQDENRDHIIQIINSSLLQFVDVFF